MESVTYRMKTLVRWNERIRLYYLVECENYGKYIYYQIFYCVYQ